MTFHQNLASFSILAVLLASTPAMAVEFTDGVRSGGMGDAYVAVAEGTGGIYHNPAGIARAVMYALDATFEYGPAGSVLNASIMDSRTNPGIAAGVGYSYHIGRDEAEGIDGHDIRLALAVPVVPDRVSLGVGGRYLLIQDNGVELMNGFTLDAGGIFKVTDGFHVGVVGKNLIDVCDKEACSAIAPLTVSGGLSFATSFGLTLAGDVGFDLSTKEDAALEFAVGAEYLAVMLPLRVGFERREAMDTSMLTFGAGWRSKAAGFDMAYQLDLANTERMIFMGSFAIYM